MLSRRELTTEKATSHWFPDVCRRERVGVLLGLAQVLVLAVYMAPFPLLERSLAEFVYISAFTLWLCLAIASMLCLLRPQISRHAPSLGSTAALVGIVLAGWAAAAAVYMLYATIGQRLSGLGFWHFTLGSAGTALIVFAPALRYFYVSDRWKAQLAAQARAENEALQARIRPHFLFNSLNMIVATVRRDPALAEQAILDLSDLFRAALNAGDDDGGTLEDELQLVRQYLSIEQLRLGERLKVEWEIDPAARLSIPLPRLVIQPLVENAVLHGISQITEGGVLTIRISDLGRTIGVQVINPRPAATATLPLHRGNGHAQRSIAYRLAYRFGSDAVMATEVSEQEYVCRLTLPVTAGA